MHERGIGENKPAPPKTASFPPEQSNPATFLFDQVIVKAAAAQCLDKDTNSSLKQSLKILLPSLFSCSLLWRKLSKMISKKSIPKLCSICLQIQFKILRGHSDTVSSCHFCSEDTKILSCSYDRTVKLWVCYECKKWQIKKQNTSSVLVIP